MALENYCKKCGHKLLPNEPYCIKCGSKTQNMETNGPILDIPIHNIGFFDFDIDFSPYIDSDRQDFKYDICSCGYINEVDNEYCDMCGAKRNHSKFEKLIKNKSKPQFSMDNILCDCGAINSHENAFCEMCGKQLKETPTIIEDNNYSNFNLEFTDSVFCFCGEENEKFSHFCRNCGLPLINYGKSYDISILCTCSTINEATSDYCIKCGKNLNRMDSVVLCICGEKNPKGSKFCHNCERPLNPQKTIYTRIICSCGEILDFDSDFCHNCGKNIKRAFMRKNSVNNTVKSLKGLFR